MTSRPSVACLLGMSLLFLALLATVSQSRADAVPPPPDAPAATRAADPVLEARLKRLDAELRCLVCQNQTLLDSQAGLAEDLRREVRDLAVSGKSDDEIKRYLAARYGDFIFYRPPVKPATWLLWFGPFVLLAATFLWLMLRISRPATQVVSIPAGELRRVDDLLTKS